MKDRGFGLLWGLARGTASAALLAFLAALVGFGFGYALRAFGCVGRRLSLPCVGFAAGGAAARLRVGRARESEESDQG